MRGRKLKFTTGSFCCQGDRPSQQDSLGFRDLPGKGLLAVVADGMGGLEHGAELSALAVSVLLEHFSQTPPTDHPVLELCDLCARGVRATRDLLEQDQKTGGTTLVAALFRDGALSFLTVGDSRLCLVRGGGLLWLNRPHSYAALLAELAAQGESTFAQVLRDPQRAALTSFLGSPEPLRVDFPPEPIPLVRGDRVILMSDGVSGVLSPGEIALAADCPAPKAARRLSSAVAQKERPHQDNYTAIIVTC